MRDYLTSFIGGPPEGILAYAPPTELTKLTQPQFDAPSVDSVSFVSGGGTGCAENLEAAELLYIFRERMAIMEIDGGILSEEARWLAARDVFNSPEKLRVYAEHHPAVKLLIQWGCEIVDVQFSEMPEGT